MDFSGAGGSFVMCFGGFAVLAIVLMALAYRREQDRQATLRNWAVQNGWLLEFRPAVDWGARMPGHNRRGVQLAISGQLGGRSVTIAEYSYSRTTTTSTFTGNGTSPRTRTTTYRFVLFVVRLHRPGPAMAVVRRGPLSRFGRALFGDGDTAIGHGEFDSAYRVATRDARAAHAVLGPDLVAEQISGHLPDWSLDGDMLLTFRTGRIGDPATIPHQFAPTLRVADLLAPSRS